MFQGPQSDEARASTRGPKPPGGNSSSLFDSQEEVVSSTRTDRMASNIFGPSEEHQNMPKRANLSGGKDSGIFEDHKPNAFRQLTNPPGGKTSDIFGSPQPANIAKAHPNKPKDHNVLSDRGEVPQEPMQKAMEDQRQKVEDTSEREPQKSTTKEPELKISDHEPRLGPRPRSHNKVLNPPGGKSSITFY